MIIAVVSQKGGVGKSTISRLLAATTAKSDKDLKILVADTDTSQSTSYHWSTRRIEADFDPPVAVQQFGSVKNILKVADQYDLVIIDGAPHSNKMTLEIARIANLTIIPTGGALDDLHPTVLLANTLKKDGADRKRIALVLNHIRTKAEETEAREYLSDTPFNILGNSLYEKRGYAAATNDGRSASETPFPPLNQAAEALAQEIFDVVPTT